MSRSSLNYIFWLWLSIYVFNSQNVAQLGVTEVTWESVAFCWAGNCNDLHPNCPVLEVVLVLTGCGQAPLSAGLVYITHSLHTPAGALSIITIYQPHHPPTLSGETGLKLPFQMTAVWFPYFSMCSFSLLVYRTLLNSVHLPVIRRTL